MTDAATVASIALSLPGAREGSHFDTTDFRVANKIFCTLPERGQMVVRISTDEQAALVAEAPGTFQPVKGSYGLKGWTVVTLEHADTDQLRELITDAWRRLAPRKLLMELDQAGPS